MMPCTFEDNCTLLKSNDKEPTATHKNGKHPLIKKPINNFKMRN